MSERELTKTYAPNPLLRALYARFFDKIHVDEAWVREVRRLSERGSIVYVLRSLNVVDFLALDYLTKRYGLPQVRFVNDLGLWILNPLGKGWLNAILPRPGVTERDELEDALARGGSAALFLKRPPNVLDVAAGATRGRGLTEGDELIRSLFELQRKSDKPILLVPQVFVWSKFPDKRGSEPLAFLLGPREWPSSARTAAQFLYNYKHVELKLGEPIDLKAFLAESTDRSDEVLLRRLTYAVLRKLERERRAITGPAEKAPERMRQEILRSPRLQSVIDDLVHERTDKYGLQARALEMLEELQATPDRTIIRVLAVVFDRVFERIYAGLEYDRGDIERLREAAKRGTLVLLPSHKSHIDYLILSYIFNIENLPLPLIAAGNNLDFFPIGGVLRRSGAFFIRRSFRGDRLYTAVVDAYIRRVIRDGYPIELFLEGGRSRAGKLLPPKFGLLTMIVDAVLAVVDDRPTQFVPVSIGYERVVEGETYERELQGGEKRKEDAAGLLRSSEMLRDRYGRINMQVGSILTLRDVASELNLKLDEPLTPPKRRALVTRLGNRVMDEINRVTAITPGALCALVLLSHELRGLSHDDVVTRSERLLSVAVSLGARTSPTLCSPSGNLRTESLREALQMFVDANLVDVSNPDQPSDDLGRTAGPGAIYTAVEKKRLVLDTSKNIIIHFFVERALVALALLSLGTPDAEREAVRQRVYDLSRLFKFEFRFRADAPFDAIFQETLQRMHADGEVAFRDSLVEPGPGRQGLPGSEWLSTYASILRNFVEGYRVAARCLGAMVDKTLGEKELMKRALGIGRRMFLNGEIQRFEAVSKPILENAIESFADQGYLVRRDGKYDLSSAVASRSAVDELEERIVSYLPDQR